MYKAYNPVTGKKKTLRATNILSARRRAKKLLKGRNGVIRTYRLTKKYQ